jgi:hypothetical protein
MRLHYYSSKGIGNDIERTTPNFLAGPNSAKLNVSGDDANVAKWTCGGWHMYLSSQKAERGSRPFDSDDPSGGVIQRRQQQRDSVT